MDQDRELQGLSWWETATLDQAPPFARVTTNPGLGRAVRALSASMLELAARDRAMDSVFKDAGRYVATMWAFYLHETGGLTLPRLKDICRRSALLSPGRARSLLQVLEHLGYVRRRPNAGGAIRYSLTDAFLAAWDAQLRAALEAARPLEPEVGLLLDQPDPAVIRTFGCLHAEGLLGAVGQGLEPTAFRRAFVHPYAGNQILAALLAADEAADFPPRRAGPFSISGLSKRFGVSRIHVSRVFAEAAREGLVRLDADGVVHFEVATQRDVLFHYSAQLVQILASAAQAARAHGLLGESPACARADQKCAIVTVPTAD